MQYTDPVFRTCVFRSHCSSFVLLAAISGCETWRQYSNFHCNSDMKRRLSISAGIQEAAMLLLLFFALRNHVFFSGWQKAG